MLLTSPAFLHGETIPKKFSQDGENINPPLAWSGVPDGTQSCALVMEDPDVPPAAGVPVWDHWIVWNIPAEITSIPEAWQVVGTSGKGTRGELRYSGPRPPDKEHRYFFHVYALDAVLDLREGASKADLIKTIRDHILAEAVLMGRCAPS